MGKKDKPKKLSAKKEKYLKFRKEKSVSMDLSMPDLSEDQMKEKREAEGRIDKFVRFNKNPPTKEVKDKKRKYA